MNDLEIKRGDIFLATLHKRPIDRSYVQQGERRPCVIISNDKNNLHSPVVQIIPLTTKLKKKLPMHVLLGFDCGLKEESIALTEQVQTIDKADLLYKVAECTEDALDEIDEALIIQQGINKNKINREPSRAIDIVRINELIFKINKTSKIIEEHNIEDLRILLDLHIQELKNYCSECRVDYRKILNERIKLNSRLKEAVM